jgi:hypothetical protein
MKPLRRTIHPEIKVLDATKGLAEYVASDESIDSYREIIRADGWRFTRFQKNAPFVDSHEYGCIERLLGQVVDFKVAGKKLVETVQWAIDVADNKLAQLGWKMTAAGYLKAVSVGFLPTRVVSKWDSDPMPYAQAMQELGLGKDSNVRAIYLEQEQIELSACIIGANPNALAKAYKAGVIDESELDFCADHIGRAQALSNAATKSENDNAATDPAEAAASLQRARLAWRLDVLKIVKSL